MATIHCLTQCSSQSNVFHVVMPLYTHVICVHCDTIIFFLFCFNYNLLSLNHCNRIQYHVNNLNLFSPPTFVHIFSDMRIMLVFTLFQLNQLVCSWCYLYDKVYMFYIILFHFILSARKR